MSTFCMASRILILLLLFASNGFAEIREFTSIGGKTLTAEVRGFEGTSVILRAGAETFKVPVSKLSEPDKDYLRLWLKENINYAFRFSLFEKEGHSPLDADESALNQLNASVESTESDYYLVSIINDAGQVLENVEMHFRAFAKRTVRMGFSGTEKSYEQLGGVVRISRLKSGGGNSIPTPTITLENRADSTTKVTTVVDSVTGARMGSYSDTRKNRDRLELMGIWIRLHHDGKLVGEYKKLHDDVGLSGAAIWEENPTYLGIKEFQNE